MRRTIQLAASLALLSFAAVAAADSGGNAVAASPSQVDLGPILDVVLPIAAAAFPTVLGYIAWLVKSHLKVAQGSADAQLIDMAVQRAGGLAVGYAKQLAATDPKIDVGSHAIASAANHVLSSVQGPLNRLGVTPDAVKRMVAGEVGKLEGASTVAVPAPDPQPAAAATDAAAQPQPKEGQPT